MIRKNLAKFLICLLLVGTGTMTYGSVKTFTKDADGVTFTLDKGIMKVRVCAPSIIEVKYSVLPSLEEKKSLVVVNEFKEKVPFVVFESQGEVVISTSLVRVKVNKLTNGITYTDLKDKLIVSEAGAEGKSMKEAVIAGIQTYSVQTVFNSPAGEALYGMGCHPEDTLSINYKGRKQDMFIKYMTGAIPVMLSTSGYGIMWDNYSASWFDGTLEGNSRYSFLSESGTMVDYYLFYGPEFDKIIAEYREATGKAPMFPKWAFGLFQSQDRYKSQAEVLSVKDGYRNNHIPVDCIVQDWFYWEPDVIGSHIMWPERYPNPRAMVDELHQANIHGMISIWPVFAKGTRDYEEMEKAGNLTTITWDNVMTHTFDNYYDAHSEKARSMYWKQANDSLITPDGWDAWWVDQCEPDNGTLLDERRKAVFATGKGIDYFNTYSLEHSVGLYTNWRKDIPGKRAFFLIRQAFAGQQRNAATLWSSDITCTWRAFKSQVPQGINACASGIPYWTSDIGGYHYHWMPPDWSTPDNRELFTRWFQFGTFSPIFRIHGKGERAIFSKNWDENTRSILLKYDNLRYRLMPYLYSLGWKVTSENYTIMRSLAFDFRNDKAIQSIPDEYMFGPAFLVSPVTERMYSIPGTTGVKTRKVYLPAGTTWYDFWTGESVKGGQTLDVPVPIDILPLYVKAGSLLPMGSYLQYATEKPADPIELRIYPGADGEFTLYEDENDTYNYEQGKFAVVTMHWNDAKRQLTIDTRKGSFPGMQEQRIFNLVVVSKGNGNGVEPAAKTTTTVKYDGKPLSVKL